MRTEGRNPRGRPNAPTQCPGACSVRPRGSEILSDVLPDTQRVGRDRQRRVHHG